MFNLYYNSSGYEKLAWDYLMEDAYSFATAAVAAAKDLITPDAVGYDGGVAGFSTGTDASWQVNVDPAGLGLRGSYGCDPKHGWYEGLAFDGGVLEGGYSTNGKACVT